MFRPITLDEGNAKFNIEPLHRRHIMTVVLNNNHFVFSFSLWIQCTFFFSKGICNLDLKLTFLIFILFYFFGS